MRSTRREFMRQVGISLASLAATRCTRVTTRHVQEVTCYTPAAITPSAGERVRSPLRAGPEPDSTERLVRQTEVLSDAVQGGDVDLGTARRVQAAIGRERLRACWFQLDQLAAKTAEDGQRGEEMKKSLVAEHHAALGGLVDQGQVEAAVAEQVQIAFAEAADHVWSVNVPVMCYAEKPINYQPTSREQLVQQAALLEEVAAGGDLDPDAVAQAQAAIERDIAFLALPAEEVQALYDLLLGEGSVPAFDQVELDVPPEAVAAARFLVELLLGEAG